MPLKQKKKKILKKKIQNSRLKKKGHFLASPIFDIFFQKFHGLVLLLEELIDAKGTGIYRRSIFKIRPNTLIGLQKLRLRPKDQSRS